MLSTEQLQELETKYQRIAHVFDKTRDDNDKPAPAWEVVFRKPNRGEYKQFRAKLHNEQTKPEATEWLARVVVVYPSGDGFDKLLEEYPAVGDACGDAIAELVGFTAEKSGK